MKKPSQKPQLYAYCFIALQSIAKDHGYNLIIHGSMARDLDLVAVPWIDEPKSERELIQAIGKEMNGREVPDSVFNEVFMFKRQPGGRHSYIINLNRGGYAKNEQGEISDPLKFTPDPEWYIDISVTPLVK